MVVAILGGSFLEPDPLNYFFGNGLGTNLGAGLVGFGFGMLFAWVKLRPAWVKHRDLVEELHHLQYTGRTHPRALARYLPKEDVT